MVRFQSCFKQSFSYYPDNARREEAPTQLGNNSDNSAEQKKPPVSRKDCSRFLFSLCMAEAIDTE